LFSNCGAGDIGFARAGFRFDVMGELEDRRLKVALLNHPGAVGIPGDLRATLGDVIGAYRDRRGDVPPALLAACPPCQGMSSAQSARGAGDDPDIGSLDRRNLLVEVVATAVGELAPRIVVVENVREFLTRQVRHPSTGVPVSAANLLIDSIKDNYNAYPLVADLAEFGVPQSRRRSFLTFIRNDEPANRILRDHQMAPYPAPSHTSKTRQPVNAADALRSFGLPSLDASSPETATSQVPLHSVPVWPDRLYRMVQAIAPDSGASAWENSDCLECGQQGIEPSRATCPCGAILPRPVVIGKDGTARLVTGFHSSYRRMDPAIPAATVTTASGHIGSDRTIHPSENRVLSPLECALLQTFPRRFKWGTALATWGHTNVRAMIGEAVPPLFTRKHGRVLASLLGGTVPRAAMNSADPRTSTASRSLEGARRRSDAHADLARTASAAN
jgi:DNA (cytosine-5)-methyltransferase 1